jgi:polar amino acid transport system permease protein
LGYSFDFGVITRHLPDLARGVGLTLQISSISMVLALGFALVLVLGKASSLRPVALLATSFVELIRNTPFLVQVFFVFFGLPQLGLRLSTQVAAILALALNGAAYCTEIIRGGVLSIRRGQIEAGIALGLTSFQVFRDIVLRPALRATYPALTSQFILIMLTSSIASTISASELTLIGQQIESRTFRSFEVFGAITLIYLALSVTLSALFKGIGRVFFSYPVR